MQEAHPKELFGGSSSDSTKESKSASATNSKSPRSSTSPRSPYSSGSAEIPKTSKGRRSNEMSDQDSELRSRGSVSPNAEHKDKEKSRSRKTSRSNTARRLDEVMEDVDSPQRRATTHGSVSVDAAPAPAAIPFGAPVRERSRSTLSPEIDSDPVPFGAPLRARSRTGAVSDKTPTPNLDGFDVDTTTRSRSATSPGLEQSIAARSISMSNLTSLNASAPTPAREYKCRVSGCRQRFATREEVKQHTAAAHKRLNTKSKGDDDNDDTVDTETLAAIYGYSKAADR